MFFKAGQAGNNSWYLYLVTFILSGVIGYGLIGPMPLLIAALMSGTPMSELSDMAAFGEYIPDKNVLLLLMLLIFVPAAILLWVSITKIHKKPFLSILTGYEKFRWERFRFAFILTFVLIAITAVIGYFISPDDFIVQFELKKFIPLVFISFILIPIQAGWEEAFFRGHWMQGTSYLFGNRIFGLIITSLIFGAMHLANPEVVEHGILRMFPLYVGMGLIFGILVVMDNGLELALGLHIANNIGLSLFVTSPESALQTDAIFSSKIPADPAAGGLQILIFGAVIIALFAWKYKWKNWGQRLAGRVSAKPEQQLCA